MERSLFGRDDPEGLLERAASDRPQLLRVDEVIRGSPGAMLRDLMLQPDRPQEPERLLEPFPRRSEICPASDATRSRSNVPLSLRPVRMS
jgi:hypothetical protein